MRMSWAAHVTRIGQMKCARISVKNREGARPLGRNGRRWKDDTKIDLKQDVIMLTEFN